MSSEKNPPRRAAERRVEVNDRAVDQAYWVVINVPARAFVMSA